VTLVSSVIPWGGSAVKLELEIGDRKYGVSLSFFTTKAVGDGTRLRLDSVQRIVPEHEGAIEVNSKPGDTRYQVSLPLAEEGLIFQ
jgi:nitrogen-specific signal transduction histidine kinase